MRGALLAMAILGMIVEAHAGEAVARRGVVDGRAYRIYVPSAIAAEPAGAPERPLVIALHGCWQTPEDFVMTTRLAEAAERRNMLVLAPAQGRRDNPSRCWNWFTAAGQSRTAGELAQILAMVSDVRREFRVQRDRVAAVGFSAGGYMAVNLACAAPDVVSAVGVASGGPYRCGVGPSGAIDCMRGLGLDADASAAACRAAMGSRARPLRVSLWHGSEDAVVNVANLVSASLMFSRLAGPGAVTRDAAGSFTYRATGGIPRVQVWLVEGMGHAWSGGDPRGTHAYPAGPDATEAMLDFLLGPE
jgi:poly(hydroxyalkanoate) depolymerase family esterase